MKRNLTMAVAFVLLAAALQGCTQQTRESMRRDVNNASADANHNIDKTF